MLVAFLLHAVVGGRHLRRHARLRDSTARKGPSGASTSAMWLFVAGQRHLRGRHQPADRDALPQEQDALAEHPARRLARRPDPRRRGRARLQPDCHRESAGKSSRHLPDPDAALRRADVRPAVPALRGEHFWRTRLGTMLVALFVRSCCSSSCCTPWSATSNSAPIAGSPTSPDRCSRDGDKALHGVHLDQRA